MNEIEVMMRTASSWASSNSLLLWDARTLGVLLAEVKSRTMLALSEAAVHTLVTLEGANEIWMQDPLGTRQRSYMWLPSSVSKLLWLIFARG